MGPRPLDLVDLKTSLGRWQEGLAERGWNSLYWNNHDQPRVVSRFGDDGRYRVQSAKLLGTVLHLHRGTPYIYQGEEFGMTNAPFAGPAISATSNRSTTMRPPSRRARRGGDPGGTAQRAGTTPELPMQWDDSPGAGFSEGVPWAPVNPNHPDINAASAQADPDSVFHHYRRLIELRHSEPVVAHGDFRMLLPEHSTVYAFSRSLEGTTLLVVANFSGSDADVHDEIAGAGSWAGGELVLANYHARPEARMVLRPWESRVYRLG